MAGCSGLHCAGCAGGAAVPVVPLAAVFGLAWVAEHIVEVAITSAVCGTLAVAAVVALMRWTDRRDARQSAKWRLLHARGETIQSVTQLGTRVPLTPAERPAIENHYHIHLDPADREAVRVIRTMIPGAAGDATTEGI